MKIEFTQFLQQFAPLFVFNHKPAATEQLEPKPLSSLKIFNIFRRIVDPSLISNDWSSTSVICFGICELEIRNLSARIN
uniref:Uncharacterized protein n=1 Tax=Rhabditophanes sp. KR3021 TaxID=114890 RepID=A0AC35TPM4_9BILA